MSESNTELNTISREENTENAATEQFMRDYDDQPYSDDNILVRYFKRRSCGQIRQVK